jgi:hypothetical protein
MFVGKGRKSMVKVAVSYACSGIGRIERVARPLRSAAVRSSSRDVFRRVQSGDAGWNGIVRRSTS